MAEIQTNQTNLRHRWSGVVKVQRELAPNPDRQVMVTSADGEIVYVGAMLPEILEWLGPDLKRYCVATLHDDGLLDLKLKGWAPMGDLGW